MAEIPRNSPGEPGEPIGPIEPGERIERHEVIERIPAGAQTRTTARPAIPMWAWLLPLILLVGFLTWYIFTQGEPSSPLDSLDSIEIETPDIDTP